MHSAPSPSIICFSSPPSSPRPSPTAPSQLPSTYLCQARVPSQQLVTRSTDDNLPESGGRGHREAASGGQIPPYQGQLAALLSPFVEMQFPVAP